MTEAFKKAGLTELFNQTTIDEMQQIIEQNEFQLLGVFNFDVKANNNLESSIISNIKKVVNTFKDEPEGLLEKAKAANTIKEINEEISLLVKEKTGLNEEEFRLITILTFLLDHPMIINGTPVNR